MSARFSVRSPDVVHETIDGETVIIDMANGAYYRLEAAAAEAWQRLTAGVGTADLAAELGARFEAPAAEIERSVGAFLATLGEFNLVAPANGRTDAALPPTAPAEPRAPFPGLAIHRFTDLQELLFLDPVHEVDETGWPSRPPQS